jgi:hypothetical protein
MAPEKESLKEAPKEPHQRKLLMAPQPQSLRRGKEREASHRQGNRDSKEPTISLIQRTTIKGEGSVEICSSVNLKIHEEETKGRAKSPEHLLGGRPSEEHPSSIFPSSPSKGRTHQKVDTEEHTRKEAQRTSYKDGLQSQLPAYPTKSCLSPTPRRWR